LYKRKKKEEMSAAYDGLEGDLIEGGSQEDE
jgi:hypothetical protein